MYLDDFCILYEDSLPSRIYLQTLIKMNAKPAKIINLKISPNRKSYKIVKSIVGNRLAMVILRYYNRRTKFRYHFQFAIDTLSYFDLDYVACEKWTFPTRYPDYRRVRKFDWRAYKLKRSRNQFCLLVGYFTERFKNTDKLFSYSPRYCPRVRGADCILWSFLTRKNSDIVCFDERRY